VKLLQIVDHYSAAVNVLLRTMLTASSVRSLMSPNGDAQTALWAGNQCMVTLFGLKLAHIGELTNKYHWPRVI